MKIKTKYLVLLLLTIGIFLRFYNLNWGAPYYFHPDERQNVVYPVLESKSVFMLDQKNFDTGTFPLLVIKLIYTYAEQFFPETDPTQLVILISRGLSAAISVTISLLLFLVVRKIFGPRQAILALFLSTFSTGLIQFAHFGTIELWEALFFLLLFYYAWQISKSGRVFDAVGAGLILGLAVSTKILSLILAPAIFSSFLLFLYDKHRATKNRAKIAKKLFSLCFAFGLSALFAFALTSLPFLLNFSEAQRSINFESDVALGKLPVFYTQGFFGTIPILFQFTHVFPFLLNPLLTLILIPSFFYVLYLGLKTKNTGHLLLVIVFLLLFLSQSFFFVKWTRYMVPVMPFVYIVLSIAISGVIARIRQLAETKQSLKRLPRSLQSLAMTILICSSILFSVSFFINTYLRIPTPVAAGYFAKNNIPESAKVLSEPYDLGITAFPSTLSVEHFNFYELDNSSGEFSAEKLNGLLQGTDYIILPSQRLLKSRLSNPKKFPKGYGFYSLLINEAAGFQKIYETPCDIFCKITYLNNPIFGFEETVNVFDRPTVFIFKKLING